MADIDLSDAEQQFINNVLNQYASLYRDIDFEDRREDDVVPRLINKLFIQVLGHEESHYEQENDWNDVIIKDDDGNAVIVIEAKRRSVDVEEGIDQGFEYVSDRNYVEYFISTNIDKLQLYKTCDPEEYSPDREDVHQHAGYTARRLAEINFESLVNKETGRAITSEVGIDEYQNLLELHRLRREEVANIAKYDNFDLPPSQIQSVKSDEGFNNLIDALQKCINEYFMAYTLRRFDEYMEKHGSLQNEYNQTQAELRKVESSDAEDSEEVAELKQKLGSIDDEWEPYRRFAQDYEVWKKLSNRAGDEEEENKRIFCRESVYTQINKILFIRIAEDKELLNKMVSNGGVYDFFDFWEDYAKYTGQDKDYTDLFDAACTEMGALYEHLYSDSIFDWELRDGEVLDEIFQKTFWHMNHYDFSEVNRDVLGDLYEQHLPKEERQSLGEFYTPKEVVNFILDRLEYKSDKPIEHKDVLDPATGSGTFLVQAANRLVKRLENKGTNPKQALEIVQKRLHGLDLNPFAVNIAQINLIFQVIDLYKDVKDEDPGYTIDNFKIYQSDSLKRGVDTKLSGFQSDTIIRKYQKDKQEAEKIKEGNYDIVIGNPPYVFYNDLPKGQREAYNKAFPNAAHRQYDVLILFIDSVRDWLKPGGKVGYITSSKFLTNQYGEKLRDNLPDYVWINEFIDFEDTDVFEDVTTYPCVFVMERKTEEEEGHNEPYRIPYVDVKENMDDVEDLLEHIEMYLGEEYSDEYITSFEASSLNLEEQSWKFIQAEESEILQAIHDGADAVDTIDDVCELVEKGISAGELDAYLVTEEEIEKNSLESEIIEPVIEGEDITRWRVPESRQKMIYADPDLDIDDYPNIRDYLKENYEEELRDRTQVDTWWELREPRPNATTDADRIYTPSIAYYNNFTVKSTDAYPLNTVYYAVPDDVDLYFLLGLANSVLMQFYMRMEGTTYRGAYLMYYGNDWGGLPLARDPELEEQISEKSQEIIELIEDLEQADRILVNPSNVYDEFDTSTLPVTEHPAVESYSLGDLQVEDVSVDSDNLRVSFQDLSEEIVFFEGQEEFFDLFVELIRLKNFELAEELKAFELPEDESVVSDVVERLEEVRGEIESASEDMKELQSELDDLVLDLYEFSDDEKELIFEWTDLPDNPLDTRVVRSN